MLHFWMMYGIMDQNGGRSVGPWWERISVMKKVLVAILVLMLCLGLMVYCIFDKPETKAEDPQMDMPSSQGSSQKPSMLPELPTQPELPLEPEEGVMLLPIYVSDPDRKAVWETVAEGFGKSSDVQIRLVDRAEEAVVLVLPDGEQVAQWCDRCVDLRGTGAYDQLVSWDLAVRYGSKVCAIPTRMEGLGLICNTQLLAQYCSLSELSDLQMLQQAVQAVSEAGLTAFAPAQPDTFARLVASLPQDGRAFVDLYLTNGGSFTQEARMLEGQAVFYVGSTAEHVMQEGTAPGIVPLCMGHEETREHTLCVAGSEVICIRDEGTQEQTQVALALLEYLVVPQEAGEVPLDALQVLSPFRQCTYTSNILEQTLRSDLAVGKECLTCTVDESKVGLLTEALLAYAVDPTDENWASFSTHIG